MKKARMNDVAVINMLQQLMRAKGATEINRTINAPFDPTSQTTVRCTAWVFRVMDYTDDDGHTFSEPIPLEVEIEVVSDWETRITVEFKDLEAAKKFGRYTLYDDELVNKPRGSKKSINDCINFLYDLVMNGEWSPTPPWLEEPDPMGKLSDYE